MTEYFTVTRELAASPDQVFTVLTTPEHFAVWFGTTAVEVPLESVHLDVRVGGQMRAVMHVPDGPTIQWAGEYVEVDPPNRLAMTLTDNPGEYPGLPVAFDVAATEDGTTLTIRQDRSDFTDEQVAATVAGYQAFIDDMEVVLQGLARHQ